MNTRKKLLNTKGRYTDELTMVVTTCTNILYIQVSPNPTMDRSWAHNPTTTHGEISNC